MRKPSPVWGAVVAAFLVSGCPGLASGPVAKAPDGSNLYRATCGALVNCYQQASRKCGDAGYEVTSKDTIDNGGTVVGRTYIADEWKELLYTCKGEETVRYP